jgi:putative ABC transport system permease protein
MLKNHLKIALRTLRRRKGYAALNVAGLAVGLACCLLIALWVRDETGYDRFHEKAGRIYRVAFDGQIPNSPPDHFAVVSDPVARAVATDYPEVEHVVRLQPFGATVRREARYFTGDAVLAADSTFFDVFSFPLTAGDPATALDAPFSVVLTASAARRYFGDAPALGQPLTVNDSLTFTVTGVAADVPSRSSIPFDALVSWPTLAQIGAVPPPDGWLALNEYAYVLLREGADPAAFGAKIRDLLEEKDGEELAQIGIETALVLEPLTDIHLRSERGGQLSPPGDAATVWALAAIALFVLALAAVNFVNLATARSVDRAKEVGVRKTVGSGRAELVRQFLSESVLIAAVALAVGLGLVAAALPFFNDVTGKTLSFWSLLAPEALAGLVGLALGVGLLAGAYPAAVLSGFRPSEVLKGSFRTSGRGVRLRQGLVVFQFAVSVLLIVGTLVVFRQLDYMRAQRLGFDKEHVVVVDANGLPGDALAPRFETLKAAFGELPAVEAVSAAGTVPGRGTPVLLTFAEGLAQDESRRFQLILADEDYVGTMGIELVAGRALSDAFPTDTGAVLVNEAAVANVGWGSPEDALGKTISFDGEQQLPVVGVFRDYHHQGLQEPTGPMALGMNPGAYGLFAVRLAAGADVRATLAGLERAWRAAFPGYTFESVFLDEEFDRQYQAEERLTRIFGAFAVLAILVAGLGLLGLAAFVTAQRTKEIGVRKVLGAGVPGLVGLLSRDFLKLVVVGFVVAVPVAYLGVDRWLDGFAYRVPLGPGVFLLAGALALLVALATVSTQALRAASVDPVKALRYE